MFKLQDGREQLYQWDLDRYVIVEDKNICEVHFCNRTSDCSLVVEVKDGLAAIPNILLQDARPIRVYAYCDDKYTLTEEQFSVKSRTRPEDYVYTETETLQWSSISQRMDELEAEIPNIVKETTQELPDITTTYVIDIPTSIGFQDATEEMIALYNSFTKNNTAIAYIRNSQGISALATILRPTDNSIQLTNENINLNNVAYNIGLPRHHITITKYDSGRYECFYSTQSSVIFATKDYVDEAIKDVQTGGVDLTGYATEQWVEDKGYLTEHQSLEGYAKTTDIPDVSAYQTEAQVNTLINNALSGIATAEGGSY